MTISLNYSSILLKIQHDIHVCLNPEKVKYSYVYKEYHRVYFHKPR